MVDVVTGEPAHVSFGFGGGVKAALAGEFEIVPVDEGDMPLPAPGVSIAIPLHDPDEWLTAMRIGDLIAGFFLIALCHAGQSSACERR